MSWIKRRPYLALGLLAFSLRVACALVTEWKPIFPDYYYTDANLTHAAALRGLADLQAGRPPTIDGTLNVRIQVRLTLLVYQMFGPHPLPVKLIDAGLGALSVLALAWAFSLIFSAETALLVGLLVAAWPSHIFYTSQNLKEAPGDLLAFLALACTFASGFDATATFARRGRFAVLAFATALVAGFYRPYVLLCLSISLLTAAAWHAWRVRGQVAPAAAAILSALLLFPVTSGALHRSFHIVNMSVSNQFNNKTALIPLTQDEFRAGVVNRPTSPEGITYFRKSRQFGDRRWAKLAQNRAIETQIYPDAEFSSWLDVLLYLPKGAFTILFMPLPGLYPMEGKVGRYAAAAENVILLALAALAVVGLFQTSLTPARLSLLAFFCAMTVGGALLEFDLGSAGRHKLLYLPMLFPFAVEEVLRRRKERA